MTTVVRASETARSSAAQEPTGISEHANNSRDCRTCGNTSSTKDFSKKGALATAGKPTTAEKPTSGETKMTAGTQRTPKDSYYITFATAESTASGNRNITEIGTPATKTRKLSTAGMLAAEGTQQQRRKQLCRRPQVKCRLSDKK
jgi:hypothetical protein